MFGQAGVFGNAQFQPHMISNYFTHYIAANSTLEWVTGAETATGTSGTSTLTYSGTQAAILAPSMLIRLNGTDIYTVDTVSGVTVTTTSPLTTNYVATATAVQRIASWNDISPNAYHATGVSSTEPAYLPVANNNKPAIKFANSRFLTLPAGFYGNFSTGANTAFIVSQSTTQDTAIQALFALNGSGTVKNALFYNTTGSGSMDYRSANTAATVASLPNITQTNMSCWVGRRSGTTQAVSQNNGAETTNSSGANCTADSGRIGRTPSDTFPLTGTICEMIFYNKSLTAAELTSLYHYATTKYTIS